MIICPVNGEMNIDKPVTPRKSMYHCLLIIFILKLVDRMTKANSLIGVKENPIAKLVVKGTLKSEITNEKTTNLMSMQVKKVPPKKKAC